MTTPAKSPANESQKKPYRSPQLKVYGDLQTITQKVGMASPNSDGGVGNTKTA